MNNVYDSIIQEVDSFGCRYYDDKRQKALCQGIDNARKEKNKQKENEMFYELALLNNTLGGQITKDGIKQISDKWNWAYNNLGEPLKNFPFSEWAEEAIPYYKERIKTSKNTLNKAWYNYVLWTLTKGQKDSYKYALEASKQFFLATNNYLKNKGYVEYYQTFPFCFKISLKIAIKLNNKNLVVDIIEHLVKCSNRQLVEKEIRWSLELYEILVDFSDKLPNKDVKRIIKPEISKIEKIVDDYIQNKDYHLARSFIELLLKLSKLNYLDLDNKNYLALKAETYILEAESRKEAPLVQSSFYQDALKEYTKLGDSRKVEELKEKIKKTESKIEWKCVSTKIEIPFYLAEHIINKLCLMTHNEMIDYITTCDWEFIPNFSSAIKLTYDLNRKHPLLGLLQTKISSKNLPLKTKKPEKNLFEYKVKRNFFMEVKMKEKSIERIFNEFKDTQLKEENLLRTFSESKNLTNNTKQIMQKALEYHFKADYLSSIHLFIPQIETTIRRILQNKGFSTVSIKDIKDVELRERILGGLLDSKDIATVLGINFVEYLKTKLTDEEFDNHRNTLCHGEMDIKEFNKTLSMSLIYIFLKLSRV